MTGIVILAAGASVRLGQPKQNLLFGDKTLLERALETASGSVCRPIIVVLGANAHLIKLDAQAQGVIILHNPNWNSGIASAIRLGIAQVQSNPGVDSAVIMLCDQPFVDSALINKMVKHHLQTGKKIVACSYRNTTGVPALFDKSLFAELLLLQGGEGAKKIIGMYPDDVITIDFDAGSIDIDTMDNYKKLLKNDNPRRINET